MPVSAFDMLHAALEGQYAVAQFNLNNLEWLKAIMEAAEEMKSPVILGLTEAAARYMGGISTVGALVRNFIEDFRPTVPISLHLDHSHEYNCVEAIGAGFTSVMFDGSKMTFGENERICENLATFCNKHGASLEAELGSPAGEEDGISGSGERASLSECVKLAKTGITCLAPAFGNMHGEYPQNWLGLDFNLLSKIHSALPDLPLVLHGGTGIPEDQIKKAISLGICKINVNTECQIAFANALQKYFDEGQDKLPKGYNLQKMMAPAIEAVRNKACEKIKLFGSAARA